MSENEFSIFTIKISATIVRQSQSPDLVSSLTPDVSLTRQINLLKAKTKTNIYKKIQNKYL